MSEAGRAVAAATEASIGSRFRLHGRDPATGLDCVGLVENCLAAAGLKLSLPSTYGLRNVDISALLAVGECMDATDVRGPVEPGDIVLVQPGPAQHHLLVATGPDTCVHAHAGLRRVVASPLPTQWPVLRHWRLP